MARSSWPLLVSSNTGSKTRLSRSFVSWEKVVSELNDRIRVQRMKRVIRALGREEFNTLFCVIAIIRNRVSEYRPEADELFSRIIQLDRQFNQFRP